MTNTVTNEVGLLVERYDVFATYRSEDKYLINETLGPIWSWEILWSGTKCKGRKGVYTELGLKNLIREGEFKLLKKYNIKRDKDKNEP